MITGELVHVGTGSGWVTATRDGWTASGTLPVERLLAEAQAGTSPHPVVRGAPWA